MNDAAIDALLRRRWLEEMYDRLSEEEKHQFVLMTLDQRPLDDIMAALSRQQSQLAAIDTKVSRQTWFADLTSNIAGNAIYDGAVWLISRLVRRL